VPTAPIVSEPSPPSPAPGRDQRVTAIGPNWFACVMGTGIVANAGAVLPFHLAGRSSFVLTVWIVAASLLIALVVATLAHWVRHPAIARSHGRDLAMAPFYGAPPMALLTVGAGALLVGYRLIGLRAAVDADWVLWIAGTVLGLLSATVMPYRLFTHGETRARDAAFGGWLMPIVPPMVSAATGALLIPHVASRSGRASLLYGCYALFGLSLIASIIVITLIWGRLARHGSDDAPRVPTLWIVLGPLGQSITAAGLLAANPPSPLRWSCSGCSTASRCGGSRCSGAAWRARSPCGPPAAACASRSTGGASSFPSARWSPAPSGWRSRPTWPCFAGHRRVPTCCCSRRG